MSAANRRNLQHDVLLKEEKKEGQAKKQGKKKKNTAKQENERA